MTAPTMTLALRWPLAAALALLLAAGALAQAPRGLPPVDDPAELGLDAAKLAQIGPKMASFVEKGEISGAVTLVAYQGRRVQREAVGYADIESKTPMRPDTLFAVASMTKPIAAAAVMILQDEGKLSIDDPVAKHLPAFANVKLADGKTPRRPITLRDCMTHTAGLDGAQRTEATLEATVEEIARRPLKFEPGEQWSYSPGLNVVGRVVEVVSGKPFDEFLKERIFLPLSMRDTTFNPTSDQRERIARLYQPGQGEQKLAPAGHWLRDDAGQRAPNPSGGLYSTADDMSRFYQMVLNGGELDGRRVLSQESAKAMTSRQSGDVTTGFTPGNCWGLGFCLVREPQGVSRMLSPGTFGHGGAFGTQGWVDPEKQMIFVLMIQRTNFGNSDASPIREAFQELAVAGITK